jgi:hypothetical protein
MYDVIYIDSLGRETSVAHLVPKQDACDLARKASLERGCGRMMLPGSSKPHDCVCVVPVDDLTQAA